MFRVRALAVLCKTITTFECAARVLSPPRFVLSAKARLCESQRELYLVVEARRARQISYGDGTCPCSGVSCVYVVLVIARVHLSIYNS